MSQLLLPSSGAENAPGKGSWAGFVWWGWLPAVPGRHGPASPSVSEAYMGGLFGNNDGN